MAINLTTLFTGIGKLARALKDNHLFQVTTLPTDVNAAIAAIGTLYDVSAPLPSALLSAQQAPAIASALQLAARSYLLAVVNADAPLASRFDVALALEELLRQMATAVASVAANDLTILTTAAAGNIGTGTIASTLNRGDGLEQKNLFAETGALVCMGDAQSSTANEGAEPWSWRGDFAPSGVLGYDWPGYSGSSARLGTIDSHAGNNGSNLLVNSGFEAFTVANTPDNWALQVGAPGTNILSEATTFHRGAKALRLVGNGTMLHSLAQTFNDATGTTAALRPNRTYAYALWTRAASGSATLTGTSLAVRFVDGSDVLVNDDQGAGQFQAWSQAAVGTGAWVPFTGVLRTPKVLPASLKLQLVIQGTAIPTGSALLVDSLGFGEATFLYAGGPALALFAGATPWKLNDRYAVTTTNNHAGTSRGASFQRVFDRFFGMRQLGLLLPYSGSPTLPDSLIG